MSDTPASADAALTAPPRSPAPSPRAPSAPAVPGGQPRLNLAAIPEPLWRELARQQLLLPLLRQAVASQAVAGVELSGEERTQAIQQWTNQYNIRSAEQLQAHLQNQVLTEADATWQAELPVRISRHCQQHFLHRAENRFLARKNQMDQVIYSLLRVEDGALARELYLRIAEGEADFAELAAAYAKGPERATRGVVGPVPLLQAHPALSELLRTSKPGQLRPPLQIEQWWLVVRMENLRSASFDDEMQQRMAKELFDEWVEDEVRKLLAEHAVVSASPAISS